MDIIGRSYKLITSGSERVNIFVQQTNKQTHERKNKQLSNNLTMWLSGKGKESDPTDALANGLVVCRWCVSQHVGQCVGRRIGRCVGRCVGRIRFFTFTENCTLMVKLDYLYNLTTSRWLKFFPWRLFPKFKGYFPGEEKEIIVCHIMKIKWG